ncbi:MAG: response regulator transcription factor [Vulcanimicrobiota bacterium]
MKKKIRITVIEDIKVMRELLAHRLQLTDEFDVKGQWKDAESALKSFRSKTADVAVVDYLLPGMNGIEFARKARLEFPDLKTIILTVDGSIQHVREAFRAGVSGYLIKDTSVEEMIFAIKAVSRGKMYVCTELIKELVMSTGSPGNDDIDR